jgi:hypothetical protein
MTTCPQGHVSNDPDWCDTCGAPIGSTASPSASSATGAAPSPASSSVSPSVIDPAGTRVGANAGLATINCPSCGDPNPESNLFCESCGLDFVTGQVPPPPIAAPAAIADPQPINGLDPLHDPGTDLGWEVVLTVDTEWFAAKGEGIGTPPTRSERVEELRHSPLVIGRTRSSGKSPGIVIDDDHGISRRHAELTLDAATNTWTITDLGSTNGTFLVGADIVLDASLAPLTPNTPVAVMPTDRVFVGAWTRLTLQPLQPLLPHVKP